MDLNKLMLSLHPLERKILPFLKDNISLQELSELSQLSNVEAMRALQWFESKDIVKIITTTSSQVSLDKNGIHYFREGLPERHLLNVLKNNPLTIQQIEGKSNLSKEEISVAIGILKQKKALEIVKDKEIKFTLNDHGIALFKTRLPEEDSLKELSQGPFELSRVKDKTTLNLFLKRKEFVKIENLNTKTIKLTELGKKLKTVKIDSDLIETLTSKISLDKSWRNKKFRHYNLNSQVPKIYPGKRHFVNEAIQYIRRIWLDMGFKEMDGPLLETSFWNFDALFTPQDHPAREIQDTFFIDNYSKIEDKKLMENVKATHENGWTTGSKGWQYKWQEKEASQLVLRTHTTSISARTLASIKLTDLPVKYFTVGKVFRNETVDRSHLFEFTQTEGIIIDENTNFKQLLGYLKEFFLKMGFEKIRIRPSYFPYVEMGSEVEVFHPIQKKWIELGGAGMLRPEVVKPLLGKDISVLAWGLGVERIITDYYKITDLRDLYKNDLKQLREMKVWIK